MSSTREAEHRRWLEANTMDETPASSGSTTPAAQIGDGGANAVRVRDVQDWAIFRDQQKKADWSTPEGRKVALRAAQEEETAKQERISAAAKLRNANIIAEQERVRRAHELENQRRVEARQAVVAQTIAADIKASIKSIMMPNLDILDECRILVERQRKSHIPEYWAAAVKQIRARK